MNGWGLRQRPGLHSRLLLTYRGGEGACLGVYRRLSGTELLRIRAGRRMRPQQQALHLRFAQRHTLNLNLQLQAYPAHSSRILFVPHPWSREQAAHNRTGLGEPEREGKREKPLAVGGVPRRGRGETRCCQRGEVPRRGRGRTRGGAGGRVLGKGLGEERGFQRGGGRSQEGEGAEAPASPEVA